MEISEPRGRLFQGALLMIGLIVGGWILGAQIKAIKLADRYVTVKGLVERTVKSDNATWTLSFKEAGDDLKPVFARSESDKEKVLNFLASQGVSPAEITIGQISVTDRQTNEYSGNDAHASRYIVQQSITASSADVDKIARAGEKTAQLVEAGIVLSGNSSIVYKFNGLNALKPDMITEATRNARASADRFAADSGSQVGSIRSASQGVFSVTAANLTAPAEGEDGPSPGDDQGDTSIMKKVRVVSTIDYYLLN